MIANPSHNPVTSDSTRTLSFIKEYGNWYVDLPEFLEKGLGLKADLMMVDGADTFLDLLSNHGNKITLTLSYDSYVGYHCKIVRIKNEKKIDLQREVGYELDDYGAYYQVIELHDQPFDHQLWLCPVTEYVFGDYPEVLFISIILQ